MSLNDSACLPELFSAIAGQRTILRLFQPADITAEYISWLNDPAVTQFSNQRFSYHTAESCAQDLAGFEDKGVLFLKIERKADGVFVGTMTAYYHPQHRTVDMGIMVGRRSEWGNGLGQDAWNTLLDWLLSQYCVRKVTAGTMRCNLSMVRLMERSGMLFEAAIPRQELLDGAPQDLLFFGKFSGH